MTPLIIYVCSAGAGRTGTYMAIDTMMYELEERQTANIFEYVERMRTRRTQMVQNAVSVGTYAPAQPALLSSLCPKIPTYPTVHPFV